MTSSRRESTAVSPLAVAEDDRRAVAVLFRAPVILSALPATYRSRLVVLAITGRRAFLPIA
jgi:hypothetical protein